MVVKYLTIFVVIGITQVKSESIVNTLEELGEAVRNNEGFQNDISHTDFDGSEIMMTLDIIEKKLGWDVTHIMEGLQILHKKRKCPKHGVYPTPIDIMHLDYEWETIDSCFRTIRGTLFSEMDLDSRSDITAHKKYCEEINLFDKCIVDFAYSTKICFSNKEQTQLKSLYSKIQEFFKSFCDKEGHQLALLIIDGISTCSIKSKYILRNCLNAPGMKNITSFNENQCQKQTRSVQACFMAELKTCNNTAQFMYSLFESIMDRKPCKTSTSSSSATGRFFSLITILGAPGFYILFLVSVN